MRNYQKPQITEELIELQDIIALSNGGEYDGEGDEGLIDGLGWVEE